MKRPLRAFAASVALCLVATIGAVSTASAEVGPVKRVSCPSVGEINKLEPGIGLDPLDRLEATPYSCTYYTQGETGNNYSIDVVLQDDASTPAQAEAIIRAGWPKDYGYYFEPQPLPALGKGAFAWADASPYEVIWQLSPGVVASMYGLWGEKDLVPVAKLFRPMMEVYTIPGERIVNGRKWRTTCENYSRTARCRTDIYATVIKRTATGYLKVNGWAFNSLTYRWSDRALWSTNPLGKNGSWTSADGRQWTTECDNATTGRGACRSYLITTVIDFKDGKYVSENKRVFNNQVLFTN